MLEILILRHGQSVADIEGRMEGRADYPLTELGVRQAQAAARWVKQTYPPLRIYTSSLLRTIQTAEIIAAETGCPVIVEDDLMEWNNGVLAGLLREEAHRKYPIPPGGRKPYESVEGGESIIAFRARVEAVWSKIIYSSQGLGRVAIVTHGGVIHMLFRAFLNLGMSDDTWLGSGDTAMHLWELDGAMRRVVFTNSMVHLDAGMNPHG
jgi:2,3-bisphosphoglycerate-dependent phosphoglycerate mutase